jgi:putative transcriptional regulator
LKRLSPSSDLLELDGIGLRSLLMVRMIDFRCMVVPRRIENVKFNKKVGGVSADGLVVMTWAFQAESPRSKPKTRVRIPVGAFVLSMIALPRHMTKSFSLTLYSKQAPLSSMSAGGDISDIRGLLAEKMAGEITLSQNPGETLKKWRRNFGITQTELSNHLGISPSVISDYESGRRRSPGILIVSKIIDALLTIDEFRGSNTARTYSAMLSDGGSFGRVCCICEYSEPVSLSRFVDQIGACVVCGDVEVTIYGYTIIDSLKAILELLPDQFHKIYGRSTARALIFTGVSTGRSPMVAVRVSHLKPGAVILQGIDPSEVDGVARRIAELERIPLLATTISAEDLATVLNHR